MVLHNYHAEISGAAFDTELDIPDPDDPKSFALAVRNHIDAIYRKLGIGSRGELATQLAKRS